MARWLLACCLFVSIACGASLRQAQRSAAHYEQCYGADYDPAVAPDRRRDCWSAWLEAHAAGEPPEKVRYAEMRLQQLAVDDSTRVLPGDEPGMPREPRAHAYPRPVPWIYQTSGCDPYCNDGWARCNGYCDMKDTSCAAACESEFRVCVDGCP